MDPVLYLLLISLTLNNILERGCQFMMESCRDSYHSWELWNYVGLDEMLSSLWL